MYTAALLLSSWGAKAPRRCLSALPLQWAWMVTAAPIGAKLAANQGVSRAWWCLGCASDIAGADWGTSAVMLAGTAAMGLLSVKARL